MYNVKDKISTAFFHVWENVVIFATFAILDYAVWQPIMNPVFMYWVMISCSWSSRLTSWAGIAKCFLNFVDLIRWGCLNAAALANFLNTYRLFLCSKTMQKNDKCWQREKEKEILLTLFVKVICIENCIGGNQPTMSP